MADAENDPGTPPAGGAELTIPKHRLDEALAEVRRAREELAIKDQLLMQTVNARNQPQAPVEQEERAEDYGLDQQTFQNIQKLIDVKTRKAVAKKEAEFSQQIGILANRTEKAELLATHGSDKAKYLDRVQKMQQDQFRQTGTFMPAELALKLIQSDEREREVTRLLAENQALRAGQSVEPTEPPAQVAPSQSYSGVPNAAATRQVPSVAPAAASGPAQTKSFSELSVEEMEARLDRGISGGSIL